MDGKYRDPGKGKFQAGSYVPGVESSLFRLKLAKGLRERFIQEDDTDRICEDIYRTGEELEVGIVISITNLTE